MGVQTRIVLYHDQPKAAEHAAAQAFARIAELESILSDYRPNSELSRLPERAQNWTAASPDLIRILSSAREISEASDGAFDITVGPATKLWRQTRQSGALPDKATLDACLARIDWRCVEVDAARRQVRITRPGVELDAGGIAKCDAAQQARDTLVRLGFPRCLVALAGDISVGQAPPGAKGWTIALGGPNAPTLVVTDTCVSTSGDTEQFVEIQGRRYAHIVDPRTALGTPGGIRVTSVHPVGAIADAICTATCVMGGKGVPELATRFDAGILVQAGGAAFPDVYDPRHRLRSLTPPTP